MSISARELTPAERLLLYRRRNHLTQDQAAEDWAVNPWTYRMWEGGHRTDDIPSPGLGALRDHEVCLIRRRRAGWTRDAVASMVGISNSWLTQMERGRIPCQPLVEFWTR